MTSLLSTLQLLSRGRKKPWKRQSGKQGSGSLHILPDYFSPRSFFLKVIFFSIIYNYQLSYIFPKVHLSSIPSAFYSCLVDSLWIPTQKVNSLHYICRIPSQKSRFPRKKWVPPYVMNVSLIQQACLSFPGLF